jgi:hypothetical protein
MAIHIRRRDFIAVLGGAATWPLAAWAQQSAIPVIGFLNDTTPETYEPFVASFRRGLGSPPFTPEEKMWPATCAGSRPSGEFARAA